VITVTLVAAETAPPPWGTKLTVSVEPAGPKPLPEMTMVVPPAIGPEAGPDDPLTVTADTRGPAATA
jgi:hypothetical protein